LSGETWISRAGCSFRLSRSQRRGTSAAIVERASSRFGEAAGVDLRLHDPRRTFASIVNHHLERSVSAYTIKRLLNHSVDGDVIAGYLQFTVEALREPMEMVEQLVLKDAHCVVHSQGGCGDLACDDPPAFASSCSLLLRG
jgi:integrase